MEDNNLFEIFSYLSKAVIIIPVAVVIIALIFRFNQKPKEKSLLITPTVKLSPTVEPARTKINIDLKGPLICKGKIEESVVSAYIKDKKIKIIINRKTEIENILVLGDCFYNWDEGEFSGRRICGLSPLFSIAETMAKFNGLDADLLFSKLNSLGVKKIATDQAKITELVNTCKKESINEKKFFLPTNILFKNNQ